MKYVCPTALSLLTIQYAIQPAAAQETWTIDTQDEWIANTSEHSNFVFEDGAAATSAKTATWASIQKTFGEKRTPKSIVFEQTPTWQNWEPIENLGPVNLRDAPVLLSLGADDYWMFGRYSDGRRRNDKSPLPPFTAEPARLPGFEGVPLRTTRFARQYDAPGGLKQSRGGYHAWQSRDMVNWVHHGPVTERFAKWVTTAEYVDGKAYIYYDFPNDQDPHVYVDDDLFDGEPGDNVGLAFEDPSHGSDVAIIRDLHGNFHVIYEDWSPINARKRSWDSPLAGHAVSEDGLKDFRILAPAVDNRTTPTGETATFEHPHWTKEDPKKFSSDTAEYEIHEPEQEAYGDWAAIGIGGRYYLFGDYDAHEGGTMSVAWFTAASIDGPFVKCGNIGQGHPDPDICFAEGRFYLATQQNTDYTSPGPWVESVEARFGLDTDDDGQVDQWTAWQAIKERYDHKPGFAKQVQKEPAMIDLSGLPAGFGFRFEVRITDTTENKSKPILDRVVVSF